MELTPINRGSWQSKKTDLKVRELDSVVFKFKVPSHGVTWANICQPDSPWAEDHFLERVSGQPLNPAPSYKWWPWHSKKHEEDFKTEVFDHTYPERFWPRFNGHGEIRMGVRFDYGDLDDVVQQLKKDPFTRQAYLPVWFPEDTGAQAQRVPCTLGYHFIRNGPCLDIKYFLRSCDLTRHFLNDVYMAGRLLQWMVDRVTNDGTLPYPWPGTLTMFVSNLHMFVADEWRYS